MVERKRNTRTSHREARGKRNSNSQREQAIRTVPLMGCVLLVSVRQWLDEQQKWKHLANWVELSGEISNIHFEHSDTVDLQVDRFELDFWTCRWKELVCVLMWNEKHWKSLENSMITKRIMGRIQIIINAKNKIFWLLSILVGHLKLSNRKAGEPSTTRTTRAFGAFQLGAFWLPSRGERAHRHKHTSDTGLWSRTLFCWNAT